MSKSKHLTQEEIDKIIDLYNRKTTIYDLSVIYKVGLRKIRKILIDNGCELKIGGQHREIHFTQEEIDKIVDLYDNSKKSIKEISKLLGVSTNVIRKKLISSGCVITLDDRIINRGRKYFHDNDYFKIIDSGEKAYWLGFLAADGNVYHNNKNLDNYVPGCWVALQLSIKDEDHIKKFRDTISPQSKIFYRMANSPTGKKTKQCGVIINGYKIVKNLVDLGVVSRKTFTLDKPNIDPIYYSHFIRGYFDGNGNCYTRKVKSKKNCDRLNFQYSIATASESFRKFIIDELKKNGIDSVNHNISIQINGGYVGSKKFFEYIYKDSTIHLKRKYEKGMEIIKQYKIIPTPGFKTEWFIYNNDIKDPRLIWTEEEIKILIDTNDKIPWSYLSGTLLQNKSRPQIERMRRNLGLKARRKIKGF